MLPLSSYFNMANKIGIYYFMTYIACMTYMTTGYKT